MKETCRTVEMNCGNDGERRPSPGGTICPIITQIGIEMNCTGIEVNDERVVHWLALT